MIGPANPLYDRATTAFNLRLDQRPALIAFPESDADCREVIGAARAAGLRIAPQRSGHGAGPLGELSETILLKTDRLAEVQIDAEDRRARVGGAALWGDLVPAAAEQGLAALHGSSPYVGIAGYSLGGRLSFYARRHGLAANHVTAIEIVDASGESLRIDAANEPELFWALRGAGGGFGVVTALEFDLFEEPELQAGVLFFPIERGAEVLHAWNRWTETVPDALTSIGRLMRFPPLPEVPEPLRGNAFALIEAVHLGSEAEGAELLAPLRELRPVIDGFGPCALGDLSEMHMDPPQPLPYASGHTLLAELPEQAIDALLEACGPDSGATLSSIEIRHTAGALAHVPEGAGVAARLPGHFATFAAGLAADPASTAKSAADLTRLGSALAPYRAGEFPNFTERGAALEDFFDPERAARLRALREAHDPEHLFHAPAFEAPYHLEAPGSRRRGLGQQPARTAEQVLRPVRRLSVEPII